MVAKSRGYAKNARQDQDVDCQMRLFPNIPLIWFAVVSALAYFLYLAVAAHRRRPRIRKNDILFQEWFASGHAATTDWMSEGDQVGVVRLIVTSDYLIVTSWFPFALFSAWYDMEHMIPLATLEPIEVKEVGRNRYLVLVYEDRDAYHHTLYLLPRNRHRFLRAIGTREMIEV